MKTKQSVEDDNSQAVCLSRAEQIIEDSTKIAYSVCLPQQFTDISTYELAFEKCLSASLKVQIKELCSQLEKLT